MKAPAQPIRRARLTALALTLAAGAGAAAPGAPSAQVLPAPGDGFAWETVGDVGIDVWDLTFGSDSTLWATGGDGPYRLDTSSGFPGTWVLVYDRSFNGAILPLGPDTLLAARGRTERSTDGGRTWAVVHDSGENGLYEVPAGYPYAGRILSGAGEAIGYSTDRGASFTASVVPAPDNNRGGADDLVALPPNSSNPGRILAAVNVSDNGGESFRESGLWQVLVYVGEAVGLVGGPGGVRAVMAGRISGEVDARVWTSSDGGEAWEPEGGHALPEGPPIGPGGGAEAVLPLGGPSALVVLGRGTVYRTDDAGATWTAVGRAPEVNENRYVGSAALGPDGRLYVGLSAQGLEDGWTWRTGEVVTVAAEPAPAPEEALRVAVAPNPSRGASTVTLVLAQPSEVEAALYDLLGRRVALLHEGMLAAGSHTLGLDGAALPGGLYVVRVTAGPAVAVRPLALLR